MGTLAIFSSSSEIISSPHSFLAGAPNRETNLCKEEVVDSQATHAISEDTRSLTISRKMTL